MGGLAMSFKEKTAVVVGGGGGIGRGISEALAAEGAHVVIWDMNEELMKETKQMIQSNNGSVSYMKVNALDHDIVQSSADRVVEENGSIDMLVVTVGGGEFRPFSEYTSEFWNKQFSFNIDPVFNCFQVALKPMMEQKFGRLLCFISAVGGEPGLAAYQAGKAASKSLVETLSAEYTRENINVNCLMPNTVLTPLTLKAFEDLDNGEEALRQMIAGMPKGANTVENVARTVLNILGDERLTGQSIRLT